MAITKITTPELFDFSSSNTALQLPTGPTSGAGGRPSNPSIGEWRYNTDDHYVEYYDGATWFQIDTEAIPAFDPSENFNAVIYSGDGTNSNVITTVGFEPDMVFIKNITLAESVIMADSLRNNFGSIIYTSLSNAQPSFSGYFTRTSVGFNINTNNLNANGTDNYVAWCWKAAGNANAFNVLEGGTVTTSSSAATAGITAGSITTGWNVSANRDAGFSIVKYTGGGATKTVGHGLSNQPKLMFVKNLSRAHHGFGYYTDVNTSPNTDGETGYLFITDTATSSVGLSDGRNIWANGDQPPTTDLFSVSSAAGNDSTLYSSNFLNDNYIAYCFANISEYCKIDTYDGNGGSNPISTSIGGDAGFKPSFVMIKRTNGASSWNIIDNRRGDDCYAQINTNAAQGCMGTGAFILTSTGFTLNNSFGEWNATGGKYVYLAIA